MKSTGFGGNYPGGHTGSLYNGVNNNSSISGVNNTSKNNSGTNNKCHDLDKFGDKQICPSDKCPDGTRKVDGGNGYSVCKKDHFHRFGEGINSGDSHGGYNSSGYPTGGGSGGGHGYSAYYDEDEDRYKYKGQYGLLGELDIKGMTGHGYTPRTQEAHAYDNNDNLVKIPVSPKRMVVWVNDLKTNPGRFQTTFYDKTMWSRPSYDPYMKRI
jgi:hypothetical protein